MHLTLFLGAEAITANNQLLLWHSVQKEYHSLTLNLGVWKWFGCPLKFPWVKGSIQIKEVRTGRTGIVKRNLFLPTSGSPPSNIAGIIAPVRNDLPRFYGIDTSVQIYFWGLC